MSCLPANLNDCSFKNGTDVDSRRGHKVITPWCGYTRLYIYIYIYPKFRVSILYCSKPIYPFHFVNVYENKSVRLHLVNDERCAVKTITITIRKHL